jgi:hypothetical protein
MNNRLRLYLVTNPADERHQAARLTRSEWSRYDAGKNVVNFAADMLRGVCSFCCKPVSLADGYVEFFAWEDGELVYPGGAPLAVFSHAKCGPDCGYYIEIAQLVDVSRPRGWAAHVSEKAWCSPVYLEGLRLGEALRRRLVAAGLRGKRAPK